jgi:hypothetical protein
MSNDSGERLPDPPRVDLEMPDVLRVEMRATTFEPRQPRNFESTLPRSDDAVEFVVETDGPIPIRALGPALYVGKTPVTEVTEVGPNTYRFVAPARRDLKRDAEIRLGWTGRPPAEGRATRFTFRL